MIYRAIGISGKDAAKGLEITFTEFQEQAGKWTFEILQTDNLVYNADWLTRLNNADKLSIQHYQQLHTEYGEYSGQQINKFIEQYNLHYKVALIAFSGYSSQLGDGAAIAAITQLPVVNDFYSIDKALGGKKTINTTLKEKLAMQSDGSEISNTVLVAFMGILRWRQEYNVFGSETGASRNSIGGALWTGQDA